MEQQFLKVMIVGLCSLIVTIPLGIALTSIIDFFINLPVFLYRLCCKLPGWLFPPRFEPFTMDHFTKEYHERNWMRQPSLFRLTRGLR